MQLIQTKSEILKTKARKMPKQNEKCEKFRFFNLCSLFSGLNLTLIRKCIVSNYQLSLWKRTLGLTNDLLFLYNAFFEKKIHLQLLRLCKNAENSVKTFETFQQIQFHEKKIFQWFFRNLSSIKKFFFLIAPVSLLRVKSFKIFRK